MVCARYALRIWRTSKMLLLARKNSMPVFATATTGSISDSVLESARRKVCARSIRYAKNTGCCQSARSRSASCKIENQRRDVFIYFDNDAKVHAPFDAVRLAKLLKE